MTQQVEGQGAEPLPIPDEVDGGEVEGDRLAPRHQRVSELLTKLATTARSFLLYDPGNAAIHRFLSSLLETFLTTLRDERRLALAVRPFELHFEGRVVYLNHDRERSLAFRLYRDGVRTLTFYEGFQWEELARLLEILSIRYTSIRQREDDMVTLLWRAGFRHLEVVAVEGIVPDERSEAEEAAAPASAARPALALPDDMDLPRPALPPPVGPTWVTVPEERLESLRAEVWGSALPGDCLSLLEHLRRQLADPEAMLRFSEVAHIFQEVRDYLLTEHHLVPLKALLVFLWNLANEEQPAWDLGRHAVIYDVLDSCGDRPAIRRLLRSVPPDERQLRPELLKVLDCICPDPVAAVADVLSEERSAAARAVGRQVLEHYGVRRPEAIHKRFLEADGQLASDLLRVIGRIGGEGSVAFIASQSSHPDPAVQDEVLWQLGRMPYSGSVGRALLEIFRRSVGDRRSRVLEMIARTHDSRFIDHLAEHVDQHGGSLSPDEAAQIGRVMGMLGGEASVDRWQEWLRPASGRRRGLEGPLPRIITAALALSEIPGERAAEALGEAFDFADEGSQSWILGALAQRQRRRTA
jgi:hypothetical protein